MLRRAATLCKLLHFGPPTIQEGASHASCASKAGSRGVLQHGFRTTATRRQSENTTAADNSDTVLQRKVVVRPCRLSLLLA